MKRTINLFILLLLFIPQSSFAKRTYKKITVNKKYLTVTTKYKNGIVEKYKFDRIRGKVSYIKITKQFKIVADLDRKDKPHIINIYIGKESTAFRKDNPKNADMFKQITLNAKRYIKRAKILRILKRYKLRR